MAELEILQFHLPKLAESFSNSFTVTANTVWSIRMKKPNRKECSCKKESVKTIKKFSIGYIYIEELWKSSEVLHGALLSPCRMRPVHTIFISLLPFIPMTLYLVQICTYFITLSPPPSSTTFHKAVEREAFLEGLVLPLLLVVYCYPQSSQSHLRHTLTAHLHIRMLQLLL